MNTVTPPLFADHPLGKIAHYRLVRKIGQGGMSAVYEAFDERLKRPIAIKLLHPFLAEMPEYKTRFFREAEACARLAHPNILQIFDVSSPESVDLYIVTELISGGTLKERANELNCFEIPELGALIIAQIAHALEHAHQKGIIHRDIKPENIMVTGEGHLKLMDFGIASIGSEESFTQTGTLLGSLAHLAPEVVNGYKATPRSDIFSLTTVLYWLLTQKLPFNADSPHALLKAIALNPIEKPQLLSPFIPDSLAYIIERGMNKDPSLRFDSASALAEAIENALLALCGTLDQKKLAAVLKNPHHELPNFKIALFAQMAEQQKIYEENGNDTQALIIQCRMDSLPRSKNAAPSATPIFAQGHSAAWLFSLLIFIVFLKHDAAIKQSMLPSVCMAEPSEPALVAEPDLPIDAKIEVVEETTKPEPHKNELPHAHTIKIVIWPFANVIHNNKTIAKDAKSLRIKLKAGTHRLAFTHNYAATIEKVITIDKNEAIADELFISMHKSKPAFLSVRSKINADVAINGNFKGTTEASMKNPIVILMPDKTHSLMSEVIIQQEGYKPLFIKIEFIAGKTKIIPADLVPLSSTNE